MKKFGLIGDPIAHSQSPALFRAAYGGKFRYDLIEGSIFEESWAKFLESYDAINITAPFKEDAFTKADILTPEVREIGATNLCVKTPDGIKAYNSDYLGVREILSGLPGISKVLLVGFGGAGKAAACAARSLGLDLTICNRTRKTEEMKSLDFIPQADADVIIYTLPMYVPQMAGARAKYILEANYRNPALQGNVPEGCTYIHGMEWLVQQAITGYAFMSGEEPSAEAIRETCK